MAVEFVAALAAFAVHLAVAIGLTVAFIAAYCWLTPHQEVQLVRSGNAAAALGLMGALVGFAIVLSRSISISTSIGETVVWGLIALIVQIVGHYALRLLLPKLHMDIEGGSFAAATVTAGTAIALGLLNAASMTP